MVEPITALLRDVRSLNICQNGMCCAVVEPLATLPSKLYEEVVELGTRLADLVHPVVHLRYVVSICDCFEIVALDSVVHERLSNAVD